jgi:predicted transcriptional regulator
MPTSPTAQVAGNVRAEMGRRNVTQMHLAQELGLTQAAVSRRITGKVPFNIEELAAVAVILDVTVAHLTAGLDTTAGAA